jgi:hypothetical protein
MTEKLALTGRMTSVIAHEINNPSKRSSISYIFHSVSLIAKASIFFVSQMAGSLRTLSSDASKVVIGVEYRHLPSNLGSNGVRCCRNHSQLSFID